MKARKILLSVILMAVAIVLMFSTDTFAKDEWTLGVVKVREGKTYKVSKNGENVIKEIANTTPYSYQMNSSNPHIPVLKIVDKESGTPNFDNAIYCLKAGQGFGSSEGDGGMDDVTYNKKLDMVAKREEIKSILGITSDADYNSILWLLDNIYLPKQYGTDEEGIEASGSARYEALLAKALDSATFGTDIRDIKITDDDIEVVQQWALWYFTNKGDAKYSTNSLPEIFVSESGELNTYDGLSGKGPDLKTTEGWANSTLEGKRRVDEATALYEYLVREAEKNSDYSSKTVVITLNKTTETKAKQQTIIESSNVKKTIAGPFTITKEGNGTITFLDTLHEVTDEAGNPLKYRITDEAGNTLCTRLEDIIERTEPFYITITDANPKKINLKLEYTTGDTTSTFWTVDGSTVDQPVVVIEREPAELSTTTDIDVKEFDLALRKYITEVKRNGETITIPELDGRLPNINKSDLKTRTNGKTDTTAKYNHRKDPVPVQTGDLVKYTIEIYNEGEIAGRATKVIDYLPSGLVFESGITPNYTFTPSENKRQIEITLNDKTNLGAFDGSNLESTKIEFYCKVTKKEEKTDTILTNIAEITEAYDEFDTKMIADGDDRDSRPNSLTRPSDSNLPNYIGKDSNIGKDLADKNNYFEGQQDDDDFEKLKVKTPDLALRKFITKVGDTDITDRAPVVDTTPLKEKTDTTAIYKHQKAPIVVKVGDEIEYTIRVYNEGNIDGTATMIEDYLPAELEFVEDNQTNKDFGWNPVEEDGIINTRIIQTDYLKDTNIEGYQGGDELSFADVKIVCKIKDTENLGKVLTNIAQINGESGEDRDSTVQNVNKPSDSNLPNYIGKDSNIGKNLRDKDEYFEGQEDDDDFEKVKIYQPEYDLALRKFITKVNGKDVTDRIPTVDVTPLTDDSDETTTAIYTHPKTPILVRNGDIVEYTIRIYNEGKFDAYAEEVKDDIPEGLGFIIDNETNIDYLWKVSDDKNELSTNFLSKEMDEDNVIKAFDPETMDTLDYKDVKVVFKVLEPNTSTRIITNIAEIKDDDGNDIDSTPNNNNPGEDDIDVEHIKLKYFDLALRKFITKVENKNGENLPIETDTTKDVSREPKVEIGEDGKIKYVHPKDPVVVANSDIVIYTLRVYNEGAISGYANEIKDDVPVGLELVPSHEINTKYGWVMYDKAGNVTDDVTKAKTIRTTYLSEENDENNIIPAFDRTAMTEPAYKEVQVAFKVVEKNVGEERIVINTAEISKDSDDDEDSTPDNDEPDEDDIDQEFIKLKYFDLSLLKWVSKVMITEKGVTKVTETGYNGLENPEPIVKLELKPNQINSIVIKYEYGIKITNEGQIAGYAKEVADYIPEGLEFIPEDNPLWTVKEDGKIVTTQLENTLLQPGESAIINVVFKWKNGKDNMGVKENWAEISKDENDKDAEDIDSTPDNNKKGEDDIDNALVILSPKTGKIVMFVVLPTIVIMILASGIILIKKYVM